MRSIIAAIWADANDPASSSTSGTAPTNARHRPRRAEIQQVDFRRSREVAQLVQQTKDIRVRRREPGGQVQVSGRRV